MLAELAQYLATPASLGARLRGEVGASVSLWSRARRCRAAWADHEAHCHRMIGAEIAPLPHRRRVVVLGSGLLRDVPIEALIVAFDEVVLIDLVHLASLRLTALARRWRKVRFIIRDLSGLEALGRGESLVPLGFLLDDPRPDFVISANVLSQIGVGVAGQIETWPRSRPPLPANTVASIIRAHVEGLRRLACPALLLTDSSPPSQSVP